MSQKLVYVEADGLMYPHYIFVGEAPGEQEELEGKPFVGKAGVFLKRCLVDLDLDYPTLAVFTNVIKIRPENNRAPTKEEIKSWLPTLRRDLNSFCSGSYDEITIIALGKTAKQALTAIDYDFEYLPHPSHCLRFNKKEAFKEGLKKIIENAEKERVARRKEVYVGAV